MTRHRAYKNAIIQSTSQERAKAAADLFDASSRKADGINAPLYDEHTATFPLLSAHPDEQPRGRHDGPRRRPQHLLGKPRALPEGRLRQRERLGPRPEVSTISAGMFDIAAVIAGRQ